MTQTVIARTFTDALAKLTNDEQKQAKLTVYELQTNPDNPGLQYHRIERSKDPNFWSVRVNRDLRIIVHKMAGAGDTTTMVAFVAHHDNAYRWAERRRIDVHPRTGSVQIVEVRERFEEAIVPEPNLVLSSDEQCDRPVLGGLKPDDLLDIGVPQDWIRDLLEAGEGQFLTLCDHIPDEAAEKLLAYAADGLLPVDAPDIHKMAMQTFDRENPYSHPDAQRRFRVLENIDELERAFAFPWERWMLYLHPAQRQVAETEFGGPARVAGSAGTGKTIVALHRAARILNENTDALLLLATFSRQLAVSLKRKLWQLVESEDARRRATVASFDDIAIQLFTLSNGYDPRLARKADLDMAVEKAIREEGSHEFDARFVSAEWDHVVDAWQLDSLDEYETVPRIGRRQRLGRKKRERLWPIFASVHRRLKSQNRLTMAMVKNEVAKHCAMPGNTGFSHVVVDEAQDLSVADLRMFASISGAGRDSLFFAGDLGQRIFQEPFSWKKLGIDVRGRSRTLTVNYRTSHQIRARVDRLLPSVLRDVDDIEDARSGTVSVFNGPSPRICVHASAQAEATACREVLTAWLEEQIQPEEIGIFCRDESQVSGIQKIVQATGLKSNSLLRSGEPDFSFAQNQVAIGTMHLAKGLEFRAVAIIGCNDAMLPLESRLELARDVNELNSMIETERHLLYVSATRARERLFISAVEPASEFLADI